MNGEVRHFAQRPRQPRDLDEAGLDDLFLLELVAKVLFLRGHLRVGELAAHLRLPIGVLEPLLALLRREHLCEILRSGDSLFSAVYGLTDRGRLRAENFLMRNRYAGPAPVSLADYVAQLKAQSIRDRSVSRRTVQEAFANEVVDASLLDRLGAAFNSGRAMLLYGPAGSGKTYLAERLGRLLPGLVCVPHAFAVEGEVIQVFDPLVHEPVDGSAREQEGIDRRHRFDERWVLCRRPVVKAGGELTLQMLDLQMEGQAGFYQAPPQVKANNGLFLLDDLGRQLAPAVQILNRWITPLDRHVDHYTLQAGAKFSLPFDVIVVFSANFPPSELADDAFLRRIGYKIFVGALEPDAYREVFRKACDELGVAYSASAVDYVMRERHEREDRPLFACIPRDLVSRVHEYAMLTAKDAQLSEQVLDWAWDNAFAKDEAFATRRRARLT